MKTMKINGLSSINGDSAISLFRFFVYNLTDTDWLLLKNEYTECIIAVLKTHPLSTSSYPKLCSQYVYMHMYYIYIWMIWNVNDEWMRNNIYIHNSTSYICRVCLFLLGVLQGTDVTVPKKTATIVETMVPCSSEYNFVHLLYPYISWTNTFTHCSMVLNLTCL